MKISMSSVVAGSLTFAIGLVFCSSADAGIRRGGGGRVDRSFDGSRGGSVDVEGERYGRYRSGSVEATGPDGGTYDASGSGYGRFGAASRSATGPDGGTVDTSSTRVGPYRERNVDVDGANGDSYSSSSVRFTGYRPNAVYVNGVYRPVNVLADTLYVAPLGAYAGWKILTQTAYLAYPVYASYPVETAVQVELSEKGFYNGPIDGSIGPTSRAAILKYQEANDLVATGTINEALLVSLGIKQA